MNSRTVFKVRMFAIGVDFSQADVRSRTERYMRDFLELHPELNRLSSSYLTPKLLPLEDGVYFSILQCRHTAQSELPLRSTRRGFGAVDSFAADAAAVDKSIEQLEQIILEAFNPEITAAQLRSDLPARHIAARKLARSRSPSLFDELFNGEVTQLSATMPKGSRAQLTLSIDRFERRCARAEILGGIGLDIDLTSTVKLKRKVPLFLKPLAQDPAMYAALHRSMDLNIPIKLEVSIAWRSTDGQIYSLENPTM
jgi:hypothetical protein